ncbi:cytochrome c [Yeosuana sp. MJ-SS3]|uniref:Cytochrome c n=1 Tax=Gilvirhabdus luticola TaxID=3079858 RepID=A0ABU3U7Z3_9FLAO|nr:c-type cytochrome [Yeosuana sp. MJ-SS3]MDU8886537.1 cytochrome c [Yeosuana sp. MJ-SS3]
MPNGEGVPDTFPPLAKSDFLMEKRIESIKSIKYGMQGEIVVNGKTYNSVMDNLGLLDSEIADVMNYITNTWGNTNDKMITEEEVSEIEKQTIIPIFIIHLINFVQFKKPFLCSS